jgi:hypothetical protein
MAAQGLYRVRNGWGNQHSVVMKYDDGKEFEVSETQYRDRDYMPLFDDLPWQEESPDA